MEMAERTVVVSNRVPPADPAAAARLAGGLVSALRPALERDGGLWFGWSGEQRDPDAPPRVDRHGAVEYATVDLSPDDAVAYYEGFCNRTLWPLLHGLPDRAHIAPGQYESWRRVNARFASVLTTLLRPGDLVWVHDYHLIPLGEELRALGWRGRLGYFHHIPVPQPAGWRRIPHAGAVAACFAAYDVVGVQTARDAGRLAAIVGDDAPPCIDAYPIGIDPERWRALADAHPDDPFAAWRGDRQLLLGVDRLDYAKGIPQRLEAFERLLARSPATRAGALLVQWAAPSRSTIPEYQGERLAAERIAARIGSRFGDPSPLRLELTTKPPEAVAAALRDADVCLVTSLADGMNLVAKEFVAVQREDRPGVLVLSDACGAAEELRDALIVEAAGRASIEHAIERALTMPLDERRRRWRAMFDVVESNTVHHWRQRFLADLAASG